MFLGESRLLSLKKAAPKELSADDLISDLNKNTSLILLNDKLGSTDSLSHDLIFLPSPDDVYVGEWYIYNNDKLFWLQGIKPNKYKVSSFVNENVVNLDYMLGTFEFDSIFIFISILYILPDRYLTMISRIVDCYRGSGSTGKDFKKLEQGMFFLWNNNVNKVKDRLSYLCDVTSSPGSDDLLFKPNKNKLLLMLKHKVEKMNNFIINNKLLFKEYCNVSVIEESYVKRHNIQFNSNKCIIFCWYILLSYLNSVSKRDIIPLDIIKSLDILNKMDQVEELKKSAEIMEISTLTKKSTKKSKAKPPLKGFNSITSFFKRN